jgi:hypothetical protein
MQRLVQRVPIRSEPVDEDVNRYLIDKQRECNPSLVSDQAALHRFSYFAAQLRDSAISAGVGA